MAQSCSAGACVALCLGDWRTEVIDSVTAYGNEESYPSLAADGAGGLHVSYHDRLDASTSRLRYAEKAPGGGWSPVTVDSGGSFGAPSALALDGGRGAHIAYFGLNQYLFYAFRPFGGAWSTELLGDAFADSSVCLAVDAAAGVHVAYDNGFLGYAYRASGAATWSSATVDPVDGLGCSLLVEPSGRVDVSYGTVAIDGTNLVFAALPAGGTWSRTVVDANDAPITTSLVMDPMGGLHVGYDDQSALQYAHRSAGGAWSVSPSPFAAEGHAPSMAVDASNGIHVAYGAMTSHSVRHAYRSILGTWSDEAVDASASVGLRSSLAIDPSGGLHIAYTVGTRVMHAFRACP
jgi:hypothetical protein